MSDRGEELGWLVLVHAVPPKPDYLRVKVGRRLHKLGAVPIKNSVYVLPSSDAAREDFAWLAKEIVREGGDASVLEASFIAGLSDADVKAMFCAARDEEYRELASELKARSEELHPALDLQKRRALETDLARFRKRTGEIAAVDFFRASGREAVEGLLTTLESRLQEQEKVAPDELAPATSRPSGATWVTRTGIHVDRMASAWLIRRFIDPTATIKFIAPSSYRHRAGELRFDMFEGEYTHEGDQCTFEVLIKCFALSDPGLTQLAELVHDVDLKDQKYGRPDTVGFERVVAAIAMAHPEDEVRLERASFLLDDLYQLFSRKKR
jgi:hypothetical protein